MPTQEDTVQIPNAPWWLPHSHVIVKEDFLASDEAWIQNHLGNKMKIDKNSKNPEVDMLMGNVNILLVARMVVQGVVAVKRTSDRIKTVSLPAEADKLLKNDIDYICAEINRLNPDMEEDEQEDFLAGANGHSKTSLELVKPSQPPL